MKISTLIFTLIIITNNIYCQSCEVLNNKVSKLIQKGDFNEALIFAEKASKQCETKDAHSLNLLAGLYWKIHES